MLVKRKESYMLERFRVSSKTKLRVFLYTLVIAVLLSGLLMAFKKALSFHDANTINFRSPIVLRNPVVIAKRQAPKPIIIEVYIKEPVCEWNRKCVEAYIEFVARGDKRFIDWAKFAANWEGGYSSQLAQQNWADSHGSEKGSFGQFQFGKPTYDQYCEANSNWQMDWKAQTRCAKKIWDLGLAHDKWVNTTNKYLSERGLNKLSLK